MYEDRPEFEILFYRNDGMEARQAKVRRAALAVDDLNEKSILSRSDDEIVEKIQAELSVKIPILKRDDISFERTMKKIVRPDMWGDNSSIETPVFYFDIPYDGDDVIFGMKPNTVSTNPPRGQARGGVLRISVIGEENHVKLEEKVHSTLDKVDEYLRWHRDMWSGIEAEVARSAQDRLVQRRQKLSALGQAEAGLKGMGFKPKGG